MVADHGFVRCRPPRRRTHLDEHGLGERARLDALHDLLDAGGRLDQLERADHVAELLAEPSPQVAMGGDARGGHAVALHLIAGLTIGQEQRASRLPLVGEEGAADLDCGAGPHAKPLRAHLGEHHHIGGERLDHRRRHGALVGRARARRLAHRRDRERGERRLGHLDRRGLHRLGGGRAHRVHRTHELAHGRRGTAPVGWALGAPAACERLGEQDGDVLLRLLGAAHGLVGRERRRGGAGGCCTRRSALRTAARRWPAPAPTSAAVSRASIESIGARTRRRWRRGLPAPSRGRAPRASERHEGARRPGRRPRRRAAAAASVGSAGVWIVVIVVVVVVIVIVAVAVVAAADW